MAQPLRVPRSGVSNRDNGEAVMRSPNGPFFKGYEIVAIVLFAFAAITVTSLQLAY